MGQVLKPVSKISGLYGQPGEEKVSQFLAENLPDDYVILNSPRLYYHGATFDIDHIVIGPNGVFVIETKNMQGSVSGGMMGNWLQERKRTGKNRKIKIGNPATQVHQYGKVVKSFLGSRVAYETGEKSSIRIYPIVVFVNDDINLTDMDYTNPGMIGRVRVLKLSELTEYVTTREAGPYFQEETARFAEIVVPAGQRDQTEYFSLDMLKQYTEGASDRYAIFEELGRGSSGIVYRGFDYKLDEEVAIKKLPPQNQKAPNAVNRFYREAQITSGLRHENIVGVFDYYEDSGDHYIVMELVEGQTLADYVQNRQVPIDEALRIIRDICKALEYAHKQQVIHCDLKPSNILISGEGAVKVSDFGIAKIAHSGEISLEGIEAGTPISMSPEQVSGGTVTDKSDVFSAGVLLYYLTTGSYPFDGDHVGEIVKKITHIDPVPPHRLNSAISPDVESVILKTLEKNAEDRFENISAMLMAVDELLRHGRLAVPIGQKRWQRFIPRAIRPLIKSEQKLFTLITVASLLVFVGLLGFQAYRDSRELSKEAILTKQYGFTNENLTMLLENPMLYKGLPVNLVGRIDKIVKVDQNNTQFSLIVNSGNSQETSSVLVNYAKPQYDLRLSSYIKVTGSVQNTAETAGNRQTPVVVADKVEPIADPWSSLDPAQYSIYPNKFANQNNNVIHLEKVEFAEEETRLFITIRNEGTAKDVLVLANPIGKQGSSEFKELAGSYRTAIPPSVELQPKQEARVVVFLEPMNRKKNSASFILGSSNDILTGQKPYVFDLKW